MIIDLDTDPHIVHFANLEGSLILILFKPGQLILFKGFTLTATSLDRWENYL